VGCRCARWRGQPTRLVQDAQLSIARRAGATVVEEAGSHAIYVSPEHVAVVIEQAIESIA
jgi:predicted RNA binding protein YcfA (HicA-like mRNA interferase family)